ncbi:MAG: LCP family protein [Actinobacteria bacterium]|nr:LCP family protein [Actinomycetota bacterium]
MSPKNKDYDDENVEEEDMKEEEDFDEESSFFSDEDFEFEDNSDSRYSGSGYRTRRIRQRRRRIKRVFSTFFVLLILASIAWGGVWVYNKYFKDRQAPEEVATTEEEGIKIPETLELDQDISVVIAGASGNLLEPKINSIMVSRYNSTRDELVCLCVPIKTLMEIPGFGLESIDKSVSYGGMDLLSLTLENGLGIEIDHYLLFDVVNTVDKLGGLDLYIDEAISVEREDGSKLELGSGENTIDGITTSGILEYFGNLGSETSTENMKKQKTVIENLIKKISGENQDVLASNLKLIKDYIDTNLGVEDELPKVISTFAELKPENSKVYVLSVTPVELEGELFYVPDVSMVSEIFGESVPQEGIAEKVEPVNLVILNGMGVQGIAKKVSELFSGLKYDDGTVKFNIVDVRNADNFDYATTKIVVSSSESSLMKAAEQVKSILRVGSITTGEVQSGADIVIILGQDYNYEASLASLESQGEQKEEVASEVVKINILNGEGTTGLAKTVQKIIEDHFNKDTEVLKVVETKNADNWNYTTTEIIVFTQDENVSQLANQIKELLGVGVVKSSQENPDNVDISIIVGKDYTNK